ncbi:hypothetical protein HYV83_00485 [Candidatus Woesearchaeota archaeon]|nr:hypothetical protein [Candidatus Woesearchaeota archaeon]
MKITKNHLLTALHLLLATITGGFFAGLQSIIHPSDATIFAPIYFIALNSLLFTPAILFSLFYIFMASKILKNDFKPSRGLWTGTIAGLLLASVLLTYLLNVEITESYKVEGGAINEDFKGTATGLEKLSLTSFYSFLILFSILTPLIDFFDFKRRKTRIDTKNFFLLLGLSIGYYVLIFLWRIVLFYAVNIFLFFALWS